MKSKNISHKYVIIALAAISIIKNNLFCSISFKLKYSKSSKITKDSFKIFL